MSRRKNGLLAGAAIALFVGAGLTAYAQPAPKAEPRVERSERTVVIRRGEHGRDQAERLRNILQLRPNQEAALTAYLAAQKPDHAAMMRMDGDGAAKTTPERLARMEQRMTQHQAQMKARLEATRRFYDQLDAGQKKAFDELPLMMGRGHMGPMTRPMHVRHGAPMPGMAHPKPATPAAPHDH